MKPLLTSDQITEIVTWFLDLEQVHELSRRGRLPDNVFHMGLSRFRDFLSDLNAPASAHPTEDLELPTPIRETPERGTDYWVAEPTSDGIAGPLQWDDDYSDNLYKSAGLAFSTPEGAKAARLHLRSIFAPKVV